MSTEDPRWGPPPQGYSPQGGQYPPTEGYYGQPQQGQQGQQGQYGGAQYGQPQQGQYGQYGQPPQQGQYGGQYATPQQEQYGQYGQYGQQQAPYNPQYAQPYAQPQPTMQRAQAANVKNPYATRSLVYGLISFGALILFFFTGFIIIALWIFYAIYYGIKGINYSAKLPGHKGVVTAVIGLVVSVLSAIGFIGIFALDAMLKASGN